MSNEVNVMLGSPQIGPVRTLNWGKDIPEGANVEACVRNLKGGPLSRRPAPLITVSADRGGLASARAVYDIKNAQQRGPCHMDICGPLFNPRTSRLQGTTWKVRIAN